MKTIMSRPASMRNTVGITLTGVSPASPQPGSRQLLLSPLEQRRFQIVGLTQRLDWLAGRIALKHAYKLFASSDKAMSGVMVCNYSSGKPFLAELPKLHCSIAHSCGWAVAAISNCPIGVDIEQIRSVKPQLATYIAHTQELNLLYRCHPKAEAIIRLWSIKEAVMKAIETGFATSPKSIVITRADATTCDVSVLESQYNQPSYWHVGTQLKNNFMIAIAHDKAQKPPKLNWY